MLKKFFAENSVDAVYVSHGVNIAYLTGFWGSFGRLVVLKNGKKFLFSDSRYTQSARKICENKNISYIEVSRDKQFWKKFCTKHGIKSIAIESSKVTVEQYKNIEKNFENAEVIPLENIVEPLRLEKTHEEITLLSKAAEIADKSLQKTVESFKEGVTETYLAWIFEKTAREEFGANGLSFDPIVAFAENSASPHHANSEKKLEKNMPVLIDCGVQFSNYCSDITRCFWFGEKKGEAYEDWKQTYELVLKAQKEGISKMIVGGDVSEIDKAARNVFAEKENFFGHSFGHGVGLDIHESPAVHSSSTEKILENMVVTAEPGLYFPEKFGIRIEDLLHITKHGAQYLSHFPYES